MQGFLVTLTAEQQAAHWQQANTAAEAAADVARRLGIAQKREKASSSVRLPAQQPAAQVFLENAQRCVELFQTMLILFSIN